MCEAGGDLFRGVRTPVSAHPDPRVRSSTVAAPEGPLLTDAFFHGASALAARRLSLDVRVYQTQLVDVATLPDRLSDLAIVVMARSAAALKV